MVSTVYFSSEFLFQIAQLHISLFFFSFQLSSYSDFTPLPQRTSSPGPTLHTETDLANSPTRHTEALNTSLMSASFNFGVQHLQRLRSDIERKSGQNLSTSEGQLNLHLSNCVRISRCEHMLNGINKKLDELLTRPNPAAGECKNRWVLISHWSPMWMLPTEMWTNLAW